MNRARFEEIRKKYRDARRKESNVDLQSPKLEIEFFIKNLRATDEKNEDLLAERQDVLIDLEMIIEEKQLSTAQAQETLTAAW
ncbi:MAG: hypothetical protein JSV15_00625 [Candidatus Bathyarchaeota archaeon]|nr:MAG: hypothetical protein JSV15_00625 [Candidatus Bathyarchaeota archaeon]